MNIQRELIYGKEARERLLKGAEIMYKAVCITLGPLGRNTAIAREWGEPIVLHDGVTIARDVADNDIFVNMGINLIREAALRTNDEAGDGTTTSTLLAYYLIKYGMEEIEKGANPMVVRRELQEALIKLKEKLVTLSQEVKTDEEVAHVAQISSANKEIGELVAEAVKRVGKDGTITVDESKTEETYAEYSEGLQIDMGWKSPYFITNPKTMEAVIENAAVVVVNKKITTVMDILPLLESVITKSKNIVLFGDVDSVALRVAIENKMQGIISMLIVDVPGYEDRRTNLMQDIAISTGGQIIKDQIGLSKELFAQQFDLAWVGFAKKVVASRKKTIIVGGGTDPEAVASAVKERVAILREQKEIEDNPYEKEKIEERLAKLSTGVAVLRVGAKTDVERREKVERVKDAVSAAEAAVEEGIVLGGGETFMQLLEGCDNTIFKQVLEQPLRKLIENAGGTVPDFDRVRAKVTKNGMGYNQLTGEVVDLAKAGIIDPTKVVRLALENAVSVATSVLSTDCLIGIPPKKEENVQ